MSHFINISNLDNSISNHILSCIDWMLVLFMVWLNLWWSSDTFAALFTKFSLDVILEYAATPFTSSQIFSFMPLRWEIFENHCIRLVVYGRIVLCVAKSIKDSAPQLHCSVQCPTQRRLAEWMSCDFHTCWYGGFLHAMLFFCLCDD